ncbi:MAG: sulfurtransferase TusA family protein, partial [Bacteroidetes bacterium]|nr:sulfurtransferase TusA family protein [Bacteroidota bacterium]
LKRKGFEYHTEALQKDLFHTYFKNTANKKIDSPDNIPLKSADNKEFDKMLNTFIGKMKTIDVRHLEMPLPLVTILNELDNLPEGHSLFVQHKKIPQFLLPELKEKKFYWLIREDGPGDVKLLIFR